MRVLETCLYVHDLDEAEAFYVNVLGFQVFARLAGRHLFLRAQDAMLLLFDPRESVKPGSTPVHAGSVGGHVCFAMAPQEAETWHARLVAAGLSVTRYRWGERGESLYFHDPSGNLLELAPPRIWGL
ncbi:VOC family protein [Deinococcus yavapaiensis]|uniref:Catechol 2,3-dioxygenase-like lactoylglutathione lyase family enzyme n=1 Tax=Deinococcus yavapaiensis KR-236 TaxID=694435 RepID=A0A318S7Z2_9DEIO|nr:VOC family protein [Deinococcus yavapaiensis]PYE51151.1 catechol 2,3-dioxygenase-like lactoylglutathione lyase family enzyme [Deinococcus yavapaiensis KR-236]